MYDLAILGGGPGGYVAAQRAAEAGLNVVLFEKKALGGVCLNEGCIPTKTLLYSAKVYNYAKNGEKYGVYGEDARFDYSKILARKNKVVKKLVGAIKVSMRNHNVEVVNAEAVIQGRDDSGIISLSAAEQHYEAKNLLICTGSEAFMPPIPGLKEAGDIILSNREILALEEVPSELIVIGGGVIGMEFAAFFNCLGTKVTVVEMLPKILGPMDDEISSMLQKAYDKKGIEFRLNSKVCAIEGNTVVCENAGGEEFRVSGDKILVSVGRRAVLHGYGLENIGVECERGIKVDSRMRTNVPNVYAAGDVKGFSMLAHSASREGEVAVNNILGKEDSMSYKAIPGVVYTNPEVAGVGYTEQQAISENIEHHILKLPMAYSGRFVAENEGTDGLCKLIVDKEGKVIGCHMLGNPCSEIIQSACIAIETGMSVKQLREIVFPHPTVSEIIKETAFTLN